MTDQMLSFSTIYSPYIFTFLEGILSFISPCLLPMLPIYFLYLAGNKEKSLQIIENSKTNPTKPISEDYNLNQENILNKDKNINSNENNEKKNKIFKKDNTLILNSIGFVIGFTIIFVLMGAFVTQISKYFGFNNSLFKIISGSILILFGLNFIGLFKLKFLNFEKKINFIPENLNFIKSILFGIAFSLGWSPCLSLYLGAALAVAANSETVLNGILLLFLYSLGLAIPFILSAILFENVKSVLKNIQKQSRKIEIISGVLIIIFGILIIFDLMKYIVFE